MDAIIWEYRLQDRKPGTYLALGVGMAAAYVVYVMQLPPWVWALAAAYLALVFIRLSINRGTTFRLTPVAIDCTLNGKRRTIALTAIRALAQDADTPSVCQVQTADGSVLRIPCGDAKRAAHLVALVSERLTALRAV